MGVYSKGEKDKDNKQNKAKMKENTTSEVRRGETIKKEKTFQMYIETILKINST